MATLVPDANGWASNALPGLTDDRLIELFVRLYRKDAVIGSGSTMDALIAEINGKVRLSEAGHFEKLVSSLTNLDRTLGSELTSSDRHAAEGLRVLIEDSIGYAEEKALAQGTDVQSLLNSFGQNSGAAFINVAPVLTTGAGEGESLLPEIEEVVQFVENI